MGDRPKVGENRLLMFPLLVEYQKEGFHYMKSLLKIGLRKTKKKLETILVHHYIIILVGTKAILQQARNLVKFAVIRG